MDKDKKKTLTISSNLKKKLIQAQFILLEKNHFQLKKKKLLNLIKI